MKTESGESGQGGCLVEHVQVSDRKLLGNALGNFQGGALVDTTAFILSKLDAARASLRFNGELHKLGGGGDGQSLVERVELLADFGELAGVDGDN